MSALLVAALLAPLIGALAVLVVPPPGQQRRPRRPRRESTTAPEVAGVGEAEPGDRSRRRRLGRSERRQDAAVRGRRADEPAPAEPPDPDAVERAASRARAVVRGTALAAAGLWGAVTLAGYVVAGPFTAAGPVGPAGVGAALLLAAVRHPVRRRSALGGAIALALLTGGLALAAGDGSLLLAGVVLVAGAGVIVLTGRGDADGVTYAVGGLVGTAVIAAALVRLGETQPESPFLTAPATGGVLLASQALEQGIAALLAAGALAAVLAGALRARRLEALLLPVGLAVGVPAVAALGPAGDGVALALGLAATGAAGAWAARPSAGPRPLVAALALLALAAAAGDTAVPAGLPSGGVPAAWLLSASAVVTAVALTSLAAISAVPGAAALTAVLLADPRPARLALVVLLVVTTAVAAVAVVRGRADDPGGDAFGAGDDPVLLASGWSALAVGAWLVTAPGTWAWVGASGLDGWTESLAPALAGGLIAAVGAAAAGRIGIPTLPRLVAADPEPGGGFGDGRARRAVTMPAAEPTTRRKLRARGKA